MVRDGLGNSWRVKTARASLPRDTHQVMPRAAATPRRLLPLLLLLLALLPTRAQDSSPDADTFLNVTTVDGNNGTSIIASNDTLLDTADETLADGNHEPIVRKKRTFGDIVFRGLADVLGYSVARKPPEVAFPPPLAPVPGIDLPLQAAATAAPATSAAPALAAATAPCGAPRAAAPLPCRAQTPTAAPPTPRTTPPCPKPRAAPRRKPRPRPSPSPPPPPPCAQPRANPTTPSPCAPAASRTPRPPAPKSDNLETITSNFRLHFNFNRAPVGAAAEAAPQEQESDQEQEQVQELETEPERTAPVVIAPRAARLPPARARKPRVYVDAFVVRNGVPQKVDAVDAQHLNAQRQPLEDDYHTYDYEEVQQLPDDDYEDVQESRDRSKAVSDFSDAVDKFWEPKRQSKKKVPTNDYLNVHFGDRDLVNQIQRRDDGESHQSLKLKRPKTNKKPTSLSVSELEPEEEAESTTTTEDPKRPLKPRVLPPTEHNPGQIDTVTVRVPPIYKERRPKKLNRERPEHDEYLGHGDDYEERGARDEPAETDEDADAYGEDSAWAARTERPAKKKRRRKQQRVKRFIEKEPYTAGDYDYYGNKLTVSEEEKFFRGLTVPPPTQYVEFARLQRRSEDGHFLDDRERIRDDPERAEEDERSNDEDRSDDSERVDDSGATDEKERSVEDAEREGEAGRADDSGRADERERTDQLSPNARIHETGFQNNYVRASNVQVDDPRPLVSSVKKKTTKIGKA